MGQVPGDYTEEGLRRVFDKYGRIVDVHILRGKDGRSKNCGFVTFDNMKSARIALEAVNKKVALPPRKTPLVVSFADGNVKQK